MKAIFSIVFLISINLSIYAQESEIQEIKEFQKELNEHYADTAKSPLTKEDLKKFKSLEFFSPNLKYRVKAKLVLDNDSKPFEMITSTERRPVYKKYATAYFKIADKKLQLSLYQNMDLSKKEEYKNYLFAPFNDLTNTKETYGGGRFIDLEIPEGEEIIIDFNQAYNPYCAYNHKYSCPIPPPENRLEIKINAGVKGYKEY